MFGRLRASLIQRFGAGSLSSFRASRWFTIAVVAAIVGLTLGLLLFENAIADRFTSQLKAGLAARAQHGAQELAAVSSLGDELDDVGLYNAALEGYMTSPDLQAVAIEVDGEILVSRGEISSVRHLFIAAAGELIRGPGYVASWAHGARGNKIAVVMSTAALDDVTAVQARVSYLSIALGAGGALGFVWVRRRRRKKRGSTQGAHATHGTVVVHHVGGDAAPSASVAHLEAARRVLDQLLEHSEQGVVVIELASQVVVERSKVVERWFGEPTEESTLAGYLGALSVSLATQLSVGASRLIDGSTPLAEGLARMPVQMTHDDRTFDLRYAPILQGETPERLLIILNDVTEKLARERAEREAREARDVATLAQLLTSNRSEFDEFFAEAARLVASLEAPAAADVELGTIRALKDNCAYYGLDAYVQMCTSIESTLRETSAPMDDPQRVAVFDGWSRISTRLMRIGTSASA